MSRFRLCIARAACAAAAFAACEAALAATQPLSLAEAQRLAVERSGQVRAQALGVDAARSRAVAAAQLPDPVLALGLENVPVERSRAPEPGPHGPADTRPGERFSLTREAMTMRRIGLMQEWTAREKRELRAERFEREARQGEAEVEATRALIRREVALAWLDAWHAQAMVAIVAEQRARVAEEAQAADADYRAGRGSQPAVLAAHTAVARLDDRAAELERRLAVARTLLARWTGPEAAARTLGARPELSRLSLDTQRPAEEAARHPQIAVLGRRQEVAETEARLARAEREPDWTWELAYSVRGSAHGDMVSVGVRIPLPWDRANRQDREVAAKLALAEQAQAQRDEALRQHTAEIRVWLAEWESHRARAARYAKEIVPLAAARAEATLAAFRGGRAPMDEVLAARRAELEARLEKLQLEAEAARAWAQLEFLEGEGPR